MGFWSDLCASARKELGPPLSGFLSASASSPVQGVLAGNVLELRCSNTFTCTMLDKPDVLEILTRKAGAMLNRQVRAKVVDLSKKPASNPRMEQLMNFGRAHSDIIHIK